MYYVIDTRPTTLTSRISKEEKNRFIEDNLRAQGKLPPKTPQKESPPPLLDPSFIPEAPHTFKKALKGPFYTTLMTVSFVTWFGAVLWANRGIDTSIAWILCFLGPALLSAWQLVGYYKVEYAREQDALRTMGYNRAHGYAGGKPPGVLNFTGPTAASGGKTQAPKISMTRFFRALRTATPLLILNFTLGIVNGNLLGLVTLKTVPFLSLLSLAVVNSVWVVALRQEIGLQTADLQAKRTAVQAVQAAQRNVLL